MDTVMFDNDDDHGLYGLNMVDYDGSRLCNKV